MKNILMVAAMKYDKFNGISKKICMQAQGLSYSTDKCVLLCLSDIGILELTYQNGCLINEKEKKCYTKMEEGIGGINHERDLLEVAIELLRINSYDMLYVRHMLPCANLISLLKKAKNRMILVAYEIPTYPYYWEQYNISSNKIKTLIKLFFESIYWPLIYYNVTLLCVVKCRSNAKILKRMKTIYNGFSGEKIADNVHSCESLQMVGVGTIYEYHGYERLIVAMKECDCKLSNGKDIFFHIVGESMEINRLRLLVESERLQDNVIFWGQLYGTELDEIYKKCNLGVGTLALGLRHADIDTAIKNIEYFSRGLPVLTSGSVFDIPESIGLYITYADKQKIYLEEIYDFVKTFCEKEDSQMMIDYVLNNFMWSSIMQDIKNTLGCY